MINKCYFLGHRWLYNFSTIPNKAICNRCFIKTKLNLKSLEWEKVPNFEGEKRTDKQLVNDWVNPK